MLTSFLSLSCECGFVWENTYTVLICPHVCSYELVFEGSAALINRSNLVPLRPVAKPEMDNNSLNFFLTTPPLQKLLCIDHSSLTTISLLSLTCFVVTYTVKTTSLWVNEYFLYLTATQSFRCLAFLLLLAPRPFLFPFRRSLCNMHDKMMLRILNAARYQVAQIQTSIWCIIFSFTPVVCLNVHVYGCNCFCFCSHIHGYVKTWPERFSLFMQSNICTSHCVIISFVTHPVLVCVCVFLLAVHFSVLVTSNMFAQTWRTNSIWYNLQFLRLWNTYSTYTQKTKL